MIYQCCHCEEQSSATWQSQMLRTRHFVFAIAASEDLLAMTVLKDSFKKKE
ncbi:MAG TPA: hypothetical protein VEC36_01725 [Patescibacteria group bacterium]|nr:hypothetical protein [Patescibacteria group bacterium]